MTRSGMGKLLERKHEHEYAVLHLLTYKYEDLDSLAGAVAYRHALPSLPPGSQPLDARTAFHMAPAQAGLYLATASVDRLDMFGRLDRDYVRLVPEVRKRLQS